MGGILRHLQRQGAKHNGEQTPVVPLPGETIIVTGKFDQMEIGAPIVHLAALVTEIGANGQVCCTAFAGNYFRTENTVPGPQGQAMAFPPFLPIVVEKYSRAAVPGTWRYPKEHPWPLGYGMNGTHLHQAGKDRAYLDRGTDIGEPVDTGPDNTTDGEVA